MLIWIVFAVLTAASLVAILWPLASARALPHTVPGAGRTVPGGTRAAYDLSVYRDQLNELERDEAAGLFAGSDAVAARNELARRMLEAQKRQETASSDETSQAGLPKATALAAAIGIPAVALGVYLVTGSPELPDVPRTERLARAVENNDVPALIVRTEAILAKNPNDLRGWVALAITKRGLRDYAGAAQDFKRASALAPDDAGLLTEFAEMTVLANGGQVNDTARSAFTRSLALTARELAGLEADLAQATAKNDEGRKNNLTQEITRLRTAHAKIRFYHALADAQQGKNRQALAAFEAILADAPAKAPWRAAVERQITRLKTPGNAVAPALSRDQVRASADMTPEERKEMIRSMVERLDGKLAENGADIDGWLRLANARMVLGEKAKAEAALTRAAEHFKNDSEALSRIANARERLGLTKE